LSKKRKDAADEYVRKDESSDTVHEAILPFESFVFISAIFPNVSGWLLA
jgi:hypothetical protein